MVSTKWAMGAILGSALALAAPASASVTFAAFQPTSNAANVYWKNSGAPGSANGGSSGSFYTISSDSATTPGATQISFSYLVNGLTSISNVTANFNMFATVTSEPAVDDGTNIYQDLISGSFSITSTSAITVAGHTYAAGSNLLTATFTNAEIDGETRATSGSFDNGTEFDPTMAFTSDFLDFSNVDESDFALSLVSITRSLSSRNASTALRTFKASSTGNFASDPLPTFVFPVPESATWAMFIVGFGFMGGALRRRKPVHSLI